MEAFVMKGASASVLMGSTDLTVRKVKSGVSQLPGGLGSHAGVSRRFLTHL